jgi:protein-S-isoprenylcysteine O-methyltransferase Ste14
VKSVLLFFGIAAYLVFLATFVYAIGFVADAGVPRSVDTGPTASSGRAWLVDLLLLGLFAVQHSVMARPGFKRAWTLFVPAPIERSVFVLASSLALLLLFWQWRPLPEVVWSVELPAARAGLWALAASGWLLVLVSTVLIDHFELFGLKQVLFHCQGRELAPFRFRQPALYQVVRHPIMLGFLIAFWATPRMTRGHLLFAVATTGYILVGTWLEERDLVAHFGETYREYRRRVPRLIPFLRIG